VLHAGHEETVGGAVSELNAVAFAPGQHILVSIHPQRHKTIFLDALLMEILLQFVIFHLFEFIIVNFAVYRVFVDRRQFFRLD